MSKAPFLLEQGGTSHRQTTGCRRWDVDKSGGNKKDEWIIRAALNNVEDDIKEEATRALETMEEEKENEKRWTEFLEA